jgi:hypothetical protein
MDLETIHVQIADHIGAASTHFVIPRPKAEGPLKPHERSLAALGMTTISRRALYDNTLSPVY